MGIEDYRKTMVTEVAHCSGRQRCPLRALCNASNAEGQDPLFPNSTTVDPGAVVWSDLFFEQRATVIRSGTFVCTAIVDAEHEKPFALFTAGYSPGLTELYINRRTASSYYLRALTEGVVCSFSSKALRHRLESLPAPYPERILGCALVNVSSASFTLQRIVSTASLHDRIALLLLHISGAEVEDTSRERSVMLTHGDVARLVSASRVATTRTLHAMEDEGLVKLGYRSIMLTDALLSREDLVSQAQTEFHVPDLDGLDTAEKE